MRLAALVLLAAFSTMSMAAPHISIGDVDLFLAYSPPGSPVRIREYVPAGETVENWTRLASVRTFPDLKDPVVYLQGLSKQVTGANPNARAQLLQKTDKSLLVLDFLTFSPDTAPTPFAEWNLMRASYVEGRGLVVYQYARRFYNPGEEGGAELRAERDRMLTPFSVATFEEKGDVK